MLAQTPEISTLSLHDALPISRLLQCMPAPWDAPVPGAGRRGPRRPAPRWHHRRAYHLSVRSEEHTSELQSHVNLVCRLLLEKKNEKPKGLTHPAYAPCRKLHQ